MKGGYESLHLDDHELPKVRDAGHDNVLNRLERRVDQLLSRLSRPVKMAICIPILLSAMLSPILLVMQSNMLSTSDMSIPAILSDLPWNPSMLPHYEVLEDLRTTGDLSTKRFPNPLKNKVVILDVDTRAWEVEDPADMSQISYGRLNHYLYAKMHGYDYKFIHAPEIPGEIRQTWVKVDAIRRVMQQGYEFVVFVDYDIVFPHMKIPIEWFIDYWNVTPEIMLTVGEVPLRDDHWDMYHNHLSINSGFMIVQKTPQTMDMLKDWAECPSEVKFAGCAQWKTKASHEQNAYADYIRYEYPNTTRVIECDQVTSSEFMKMPNAPKCRGTLINHFWSMKVAVKDATLASLANLVLPEVVKEFQANVVAVADL